MNQKRFLGAGLGLATVLLMVFLTTGMAQAASLPSCGSITYTGPDGFLAVQTSPSGTVAWGGELNNKMDEAGLYLINVLVDGHREDGTNSHYLYFPHGSLPPSKAHSGATFVLQVDLQSDSGRHYVSVTNGCRIP
ncbi:MAG: hypothetical protein QOH66_2839 [Actinomycetota bacterium]|jgi:hypothetical protein|nr:hypothetical protein [Actinomycetota bacterium]